MINRQLRLKSMALTAVLLLLHGAAEAAVITARLDRNDVVVGETVTLTLQSNDTDQSMETDLSPLQADFDVLDQRTETQMSFVNGRKTAFVRLVVTLEPKHAGNLRIPSLKFSGARSQALQLHVSAAPQRAPGEPEPVFIELRLQPASGPYYVHAQVGLTVRIFYQANLTEAAIKPPAPEHAVVRLLDEVPYQAERNGQQYRVLERHYAIFPERSGPLLIPAMQLTGRLIAQPSGRLWQPAVRGRRLQVESNPVSLDIKPRPSQFTGDYWLPARRITLSQQISDTDKLHVGEPVTRTVIMDAVGLEENMLEEPKWPDMPDTRIYPDQPQGISRDDGEWVLGHKEFRYAIVPEKPGELVLPKLTLDWWDTAANRQRTAVVPAHRVVVLPSQLAATTPPVAVADPAAGTESVTVPAVLDQVAGRQLIAWQSSTVAFAILWLLTWWILYHRQQPGPTASSRRDVVSADEANVLKELQQACQAGDPSAARRRLSQWVRHYAPPPLRCSTRDYAAACGDPILQRAINELNVAGLAGNDTGVWCGAELWTAFRHCQSRQAGLKESAVGERPDLYPDSGVGF